MRKKSSAQKTIRDIRRATRRHYPAEEKIRIVLEGLRGEDTIAELCRREGLNSNVYYFSFCQQTQDRNCVTTGGTI